MHCLVPPPPLPPALSRPIPRELNGPMTSACTILSTPPAPSRRPAPATAAAPTLVLSCRTHPRRSDRPPATTPASSDASGTPTARSPSAAARDSATVDHSQQNHNHNKHVRRTASTRSCTTKDGVVAMDVAADGGRGDCSSTCSSIASVDATTTSTRGSRKAAPRFDAAVPCSPSSSPTGRVVQAGGDHDETQSRVGGGDSDGESSDGGAAHEEISAWLHSTDDWWTCD